MLGEEILDIHGMERAGIEQGLGLLPIRTMLACDKVTAPAEGTLCNRELFGQSIDGVEVGGYEIHLGKTEYLEGAAPFAFIARQNDGAQTLPDGCTSADGRMFGTYLHGVFDRDAFRHTFLCAAHAARQMNPPDGMVAWSELRQQQLDMLADAFASALDLDAVFAMLDLPRCADRTVDRSANQIERRTS